MTGLEKLGKELAQDIVSIAGLMKTFDFEKPPNGKAWANLVSKARELLEEAKRRG